MQRQLESLETKFLKDEVNTDTYNRWFGSFNKKIITLTGVVSELNREDGEMAQLLENELIKLTDLKGVYLAANIPQNRNF